MAFGLFKKQVPEAAAPAAEAKVPQAPAATEALAGDDSAKAILELLELELGTMIRQLERAANSVAGGAEVARYRRSYEAGTWLPAPVARPAPVPVPPPAVIGEIAVAAPELWPYAELCR